MTAQMHTDTILAALQALIGTTGGVVAHWEAYPLDYPDNAKLPVVIYEFRDSIDSPETMTETRFEQTYQVNLTLITRYDSSHSRSYCRAIAEAVRNKIKDTPNIGLGSSYWARPRRVTTENDAEVFFRGATQERQAILIEVIITKQEDES